MGDKYPHLKLRFDATPLSIVNIYALDVELIEDMFSRLNEAMPLNAPEKRNALRGPLPQVVRDLANDDFFVSDVPFTDARYRHRDLAAKFLLIVESNKVVSTKKAELDGMFIKYRQWRENNDPRGSADNVASLQESVESIIHDLAEVFTKNDPLLKQVGMITLFFHLFRIKRNDGLSQMTRSMFTAFDQARIDNKAAAEAEEDDVDFDLLEFDQHSQTPNDAYALNRRIIVITEYLAQNHSVVINGAKLE